MPGGWQGAELLGTGVGQRWECPGPRGIPGPTQFVLPEASSMQLGCTSVQSGPQPGRELRGREENVAAAVPVRFPREPEGRRGAEGFQQTWKEPGWVQLRRMSSALVSQLPATQNEGKHEMLGVGNRTEVELDAGCEVKSLEFYGVQDGTGLAGAQRTMEAVRSRNRQDFHKFRRTGGQEHWVGSSRDSTSNYLTPQRISQVCPW